MVQIAGMVFVVLLWWYSSGKIARIYGNSREPVAVAENYKIHSFNVPVVSMENVENYLLKVATDRPITYPMIQELVSHY